MNKLLPLLLALELCLGVFLASAQSTERDRSGYDSIGPFALNFSKASDAWAERTAQVREFLWSHWRDKVHARAAINYISREGVPHPVTYFIERPGQGEWNIVIEARRCLPNEVTEHRSVAVVLQRVVSRSKGSRLEIAIPDEAIVEGKKYEILFKDSHGKIVNIL
jgi:hypothetical protein